MIECVIGEMKNLTGVPLMKFAHLLPCSHQCRHHWSTVVPPLLHRCSFLHYCTIAPTIPRRLVWGCARPALGFRIHVSLKVIWLLDATVGRSGDPSGGRPRTARMPSSHLSGTIILLCQKEPPSRFVGDSGNPVICLISCSSPSHVEACPSVWW